MCEERVVGLELLLQGIVECFILVYPVTRVSIIILQSAEEMFPDVRESMVCALCMCAQKKIVLSSSVKQIHYDKLVLVFDFLRSSTHCNSLVY
jgi:hypothetical protein